jgi:hypothetical protein
MFTNAYIKEPLWDRIIFRTLSFSIERSTYQSIFRKIANLKELFHTIQSSLSYLILLINNRKKFVDYRSIGNVMLRLNEIYKHPMEAQDKPSSELFCESCCNGHIQFLFLHEERYLLAVYYTSLPNFLIGTSFQAHRKIVDV